MRTRFIILSALAGIAVFMTGAISNQAKADATTPAYICVVSDPIITNTVWSPSACDWYIVNADITVQQGVTLTIAPGTLVKFNTRLSLIVDGTLIARGTPNRYITFTSNAQYPQGGDWTAISFTPSSASAEFDSNGDYLRGSIVQYANVDYAGYYQPDAGALRAESALSYLD